MLSKLLAFFRLPPELTPFERRYRERLRRVALAFFALHVPVFTAIAWFNRTRPALAFALTSITFAGSLLARAALGNPRHHGYIHAVTAMGMGGLLVHFGRGPLQIEMHFYFFVLIALLAVFADPVVIVVAALTVTLHHLVLWIVLPSSVFNYDASLFSVAVHAIFVVLESVAACFVARWFFDAVVGLEQSVARRTRQLTEQSRSLRVMLDNSGQGFAVLDNRAIIGPERSTVLDQWFGAPEQGTTLGTWIRNHDANFAAQFELAWDAIVEDVLPIELAIEQLPHDLRAGQQLFSVEYRMLSDAGQPVQLLAVVSDRTAEVERRQLEAEGRELLSLVENALRDRHAVFEFMAESDELVHSLRYQDIELPVAMRALHTLKGNGAMFGLTEVAKICHELESQCVERLAMPDEQAINRLLDHWHRLSKKVVALLGQLDEDRIDVTEGERASLLVRVEGGAPREFIAAELRDWSRERVEQRLAHVSTHAQLIAERLKKPIDVVVEGGETRVDREQLGAVWSALIHVVRNAIDHGVEAPSDRTAAGKQPRAQLTLRAELTADHFVVSVEDDGAGIRWDRVRERAQQLGLPCETRDDLTRALFASGLSTAESVGLISGRGVGLDAVRATCEALGGHVTVSSRDGEGTRFDLYIPRALARIEPAEQRGAA